MTLRNFQRVMHLVMIAILVAKETEILEDMMKRKKKTRSMTVRKKKQLQKRKLDIAKEQLRMKMLKKKKKLHLQKERKSIKNLLKHKPKKHLKD